MIKRIDKNITIPVEVDINYILDIIHTSFSQDEIITLIKKIDETEADWGVSEKLYEHFNELHQRYLIEEND